MRHLWRAKQLCLRFCWQCGHHPRPLLNRAGPGLGVLAPGFGVTAQHPLGPERHQRGLAATVTSSLGLSTCNNIVRVTTAVGLPSFGLNTCNNIVRVTTAVSSSLGLNSCNNIVRVITAVCRSSLGLNTYNNIVGVITAVGRPSLSLNTCNNIMRVTTAVRLSLGFNTHRIPTEGATERWIGSMSHTSTKETRILIRQWH